MPPKTAPGKRTVGDEKGIEAPAKRVRDERDWHPEYSLHSPHVKILSSDDKSFSVESRRLGQRR